MVFKSRTTNGAATVAEGAFGHCGPASGDIELSYTCQGPACSSLDGSFQNVVCHKDGSSRLICSNDVRCEGGSPTYQSNFTFSQNEPDPWSPIMENKPDVRIPQGQHAMIGSCARFSLTSDGTKEGTHIYDAENICPDIHGSSMPGTTAHHVPTTTGEVRIEATQRPLVFASVSSRRNVYKSTSLLTFMFALLLLPRAQASVHDRLDKKSDATADTRLHTVAGGIKSFAEEFKVDWAEKASNQGVDGDALADSVVADMISSVCQRHFEGSSPQIFEPKVLSDCVASIYSAQQLPQPALRLHLVAGGSILCNYIVSKSYPSGQDFLPATCDQLQSLVSYRSQTGPSMTGSISLAVHSSVAGAGSPGASFPATSLNAEGLSQSMAPSSLQTSASSKTRSVTISSPSVASEGEPPLSTLLPNRSSTVLLAAEGLHFPALDSDTSQLVSLARTGSSASKAPGASILQASDPPKPSDLDPKMIDQATDRFFPTPSMLLSSTDTTSHKSIELPDFVFPAHSSATPSHSEPRKSSDVPAILSQSVGRDSTFPSLSTSRHTASLTAATFAPSEAAGIDPSTNRQTGVSKLAASNLLSESKHTVPKAPEATTFIRTKGDSSHSSPASSLEPTSPALTLSSFSKSDLSTSVSSKVKITRTNGVPLSSSFDRTDSGLAQSSSAILLNADFGDHETPRYTTPNALIPVTRSAAAIDATNYMQAVTVSFTDSATTLVATENQLSSSRSSPEFTPLPFTLAITMSLDTVSVRYSSLGQSISITPADRATNTQEDVDPSLVLKGSETLGILFVDNAASTVAASVAASSLTASTAAASLTPVASKLNLASLHPTPDSTSTAITGALGSFRESWLVESPSADSSTIVLANEALSRTSEMFLPSPDSASTEFSRYSGPSAELLSSTSAIPTSTARSAVPKPLSSQDEQITTVSSASLTSAPGSMTPMPLLSSSAVSRITSELPQASVPELSLADASIPLGSFASGNFVPSSSKSPAPATVPSSLLPLATAGLTSSSGSHVPRISDPTPTVGSLPTNSTAETSTTSRSSYMTLEVSLSSNATILCAENATAPSFCPGIGCVSLMTNKAHCGACDQACIHRCHQGA